MKRFLGIFSLLTVALMVLTFVGCGGDEEGEKLPVAKVTAISVAAGQSVGGNTPIQVTFSRKASDGSITIAVSGATGNVTWDPSGKIATWTPSPDMPPGARTLTVSGSTADGQDIEAPAPVAFTATAPDKTPPEIVAAKCDPANGATGADPAKYGEKLVIAFSEPCKDVKINKLDPADMKVLEEMSADGTTLTLKFQKYSLANETKYTVELVGTDMAGNALKSGTYSFTTMKKQG